MAANTTSKLPGWLRSRLATDFKDRGDRRRCVALLAARRDYLEELNNPQNEPVITEIGLLIHSFTCFKPLLAEVRARTLEILSGPRKTPRPRPVVVIGQLPVLRFDIADIDC